MRAGTAIAAGLAVLAFVAGCGGDSSSGGSSANPAPSAAPAAKAATAGMKNFEFVPASVTVVAGGTVTWTDHDSANHNVTFKTGGAPKGITNLNKDEHGSVTFPKPGTYAYVCTYHPNMHGTVVVQ